MPSVDFVVSTQLSSSVRARQVCSMFDVPPEEKCTRRWTGELPIEERDWNVGLIVGPSGCGKSTIMKQVFGEEPEFEWKSASMIDDFKDDLSIEEISNACNTVGFNTIPAWLRPFYVLSNGERFRADLARRLCEVKDPVVVDEFTSVVDRQVAKIGSHAVQKWARRNQRKFVAVTCHFDVIDWLQPDWVLEPSTMKFYWREVQRRPSINVTIRRVSYDWWQLFAPFHYLTGKLSKAARCFGAFVEGVDHPVAFVGVLHRPHARVNDVSGISRIVVLPDWQGIGLSFVLKNTVGAALSALGRRFHHYPAHPPYIRALMKSKDWKLVKKPGEFSPARGTSSTVGGFGGRPCAVFRYIGPRMDVSDAEQLVGVTRETLHQRNRALRLKSKRRPIKKGRK